MAVTSLIAACVFFVGIHVVISGSPLRGAIVARTGERGFLVLFSLLSLGGMIWLVTAYSAAETTYLWSPGPVLRWLALPLLLLATLLVVIGLTTPSPTATGGESRLERGEAAQGILRVTRHPFLWGVALWAATHLVVNGDAASVVLFASLLVLALIGPLLIDAKRRRVHGAAWDHFAAATSNVPFAAIIAGRNTLRLDEIGTWRIVLGVVVWVALIAVHPFLFGVRALPV